MNTMEHILQCHEKSPNPYLDIIRDQLRDISSPMKRLSYIPQRFLDYAEVVRVNKGKPGFSAKQIDDMEKCRDYLFHLTSLCY